MINSTRLLFQGNKYAVKRIHKSRLSKASNRKLLESETAILRVLDHPNIVKLIDIVIDGDYTNLVLEV
jgi:serine/threonine protein kinase